MSAFDFVVFLIALMWIGATVGVAWDAHQHNRNPVTWGFAVGIFGVFGLFAYALTYSGENSGSSSDTVLRVSAEVKHEDTGEETRLSLKVHTDSVDQAIKQFKQRCHTEGYLLQEKPTVDPE